jgi:hypothetical protein
MSAIIAIAVNKNSTILTQSYHGLFGSLKRPENNHNLPKLTKRV